MPKISVIIPVYNTEKYLTRCLDSVLNQTLTDIEVICVNDCSTDNSLEILNDHALKDNRIKIINFAKNKGAAVARNTAMEHVQGEYIGFVDSDDFIDLNFYENLYNRVKETDADTAKGTLLIYNNATKESYLEEWIDINDKIKKHKAYFYFTFTTGIYKTSFIQEHKIEFPEDLVHLEDPCFSTKAALFYNKVEIVDGTHYYYTNNENSASRKNRNMNLIKSLIKGANYIVDMINECNVDKVHYMIVFNFVLGQVLTWCNSDCIDDELTQASVYGLIDLYKKSKYKEECLQYYFSDKKKTQKNYVLKQLRNKIKKDLINA